VKYPKVSAFVNGAAEASLVVEQLSDRKAGWVGLWVGNGSGGEFANLRISSVLYKKAALSLQSKPIPDQEPKMTEHFRATIEDAMRGGMRPDDYAPEFWNRISSAQKDIQADLNRHGELISLTLVDSRIEEHGRSYRYILEFRNARALSPQHRAGSTDATKPAGGPFGAHHERVKPAGGQHWAAWIFHDRSQSVTSGLIGDERGNSRGGELRLISLDGVQRRTTS
jgi:hypothetical protein